MDIFYTDLTKFDGKNDYYKGHNAAREIIKYCAKLIYDIENHELEIINGKPKFKFSKIQFSISHSGTIAAVCFDKNPVGFDIEQIVQRDYASIAQRLNFKLEDDSLEAFYKCWTQYEAAYKLHKNVNFYLNGKIQNNYEYAIASEKYIKIDKIEELYLI